MHNLLQPSHEISTDSENLHIRHLLINKSVSVFWENWTELHPDTEQVVISNNVVHFIEPDGTIVGVKIFSDGGE